MTTTNQKGGTATLRPAITPPLKNIHLKNWPPLKWKDVPGFPGYRVSDDGSVRSCWALVSLGGRRGTKSKMGETWRPLAVSSLPSGRKYVSLMRSGRRRNRYVAHLVLEAFVGPCPVGQEACHEDGNVANNRLDNIRWDTHTANMADKVRHGTHNRGVRHNMVKLSESDVRDVRRRAAKGESRASIAKSLGVGKQTVIDIITRRTWRHLSDS